MGLGDLRALICSLVLDVDIKTITTKEEAIRLLRVSTL